MDTQQQVSNNIVDPESPEQPSFILSLKDQEYKYEPACELHLNFQDSETKDLVDDIQQIQLERSKTYLNNGSNSFKVENLQMYHRNNSKVLSQQNTAGDTTPNLKNIYRGEGSDLIETMTQSEMLNSSICTDFFWQTDCVFNLIDIPEKIGAKEKEIHNFLDAFQINQVNIKETIKGNQKSVSTNSPNLMNALKQRNDSNNNPLFCMAAKRKPSLLQRRIQMNMKLNSKPFAQSIEIQNIDSGTCTGLGNESTLRLKQMEKLQHSCQIKKEDATKLDIPFGADQFSDFKESLRMRTQSEQIK